MHICGAPIWRPENTVNIWSLLWSSRPLIICTGQTVNKSSLQVLGLCVIPNFRYSSKCFAQIYRAQYGSAILVHICGAPIWRPENTVNIWSLLWSSRPLIICTGQTNIYLNTFPATLTSQMAKNRKRNVYFLTNTIVTVCHAPP